MNRQSGGATNLALGVRCLMYLFIVTPFLVWSLKSLLGAGSVDLAHHYSLVYTLIEQWSLPTGFFDETLGEMNYYPRLSHGVAAVLGQVLGSPLLGMQLLAQCAILAVWTSLVYLLWSLPGRAAWLSLASACLLFFLNEQFLGWEVHGLELVDNFFFAQLVGQAAMLMALALAVHMEQRQVTPVWRYGFLLLCLAVIAGIHLLPALELLAVVSGMAVLDAWQRRRHAQRVRLILSYGMLAVFAFLVLVRHPTFKVMRELSQSDGHLKLLSYSGFWPLAGYSLGVLLLSAGLIWTWLKLPQKLAQQVVSEGAPVIVDRDATRYPGLRMLALLGMAISAACLAQLLALSFGLGSEYAIKKYLYGLNTVALLELACLPLVWHLAFGKERRDGAQGDMPSLRLLHAGLLLPVLSVLAFQLVQPQKNVVDTARIVALEQHLRLLHASSPPSVSGQYVYVMPITGLPPVVSYLFSISIFKAPRQHNVYDLMFKRPLSEPNLVDAFVAEPGTMLGGMVNCRRAASNFRVLMIDAACSRLQENQGVALIAFNRPDGTEPCVISGFSDAEATGRWTIGKEVTVHCPVPYIGNKPATAVRLSAAAFITGAGAASNTQRLAVTINGGPVATTLFTEARREQPLYFKLPAKIGATMELHLSLPDAVSPKQLGLSGDDRALGLFVRTLEFIP